MVRNYTYQVFTEFVYVRMKGLVWCYNGLTNPSNIDKSAGDAMAQIYNEVETSKYIIIDMKGVSGVTDHALDVLFQSIESKKREVLFVNSESLEQKISSAKREFCSNLKIQINDNSVALFHTSQKSKYDKSIQSIIHIHFINLITGYIQDSFHPYENDELKLLASTPIYASGEFDAAKIVSEPASFYWVSIILSDEIEKIISDFKLGGGSRKPKLLTVSLRSSPLAGSIGQLLGLQIETVDHFGPVLGITESSLTPLDNAEYIYVGDFTVGGTEIKVSKTYALMRNAKLNHAVVLASLLSPELYKEFTLHALILIKDCGNVKYSLEP